MTMVYAGDRIFARIATPLPCCGSSLLSAHSSTVLRKQATWQCSTGTTTVSQLLSSFQPASFRSVRRAALAEATEN